MRDKRNFTLQKQKRKEKNELKSIKVQVVRPLSNFLFFGDPLLTPPFLSFPCSYCTRSVLTGRNRPSYFFLSPDYKHIQDQEDVQEATQNDQDDVANFSINLVSTILLCKKPLFVDAFQVVDGRSELTESHGPPTKLQLQLEVAVPTSGFTKKSAHEQTNCNPENLESFFKKQMLIVLCALISVVFLGAGAERTLPDPPDFALSAHPPGAARTSTKLRSLPIGTYNSFPSPPGVLNRSFFSIL